MDQSPGAYIRHPKDIAAMDGGAKKPSGLKFVIGYDNARPDVYFRLPKLRAELSTYSLGDSYRFRTDLFAVLLYLTIFKLQWSVITNFDDFSGLMTTLLEDDVEPFLISLHHAAIHRPELVGEGFERLPETYS